MPLRNGGMQHQDWLKTLTPEQYDAYLLKRKNKRNIKKSMDAVLEKFSDELTAKVFNSLLAQLDKAQDGDTQAFIAAWDRTVGKPKDDITINTDKPLEWNDDFDE